MCGIVAYLGNKKAAPILLEGLRRMEYRGYDSAGVTLIDAAGKFVQAKAVGKIANLAPLLPDILSGIGIGHTRWATHGAPSDINAHPHLDCHGKVAVVHNGIIENHKSLRHRLESAGHRFSSETDTEVIAHLIEENVFDLPLEQAVMEMLPELKGTYGIAVVSPLSPKKIVVARMGSPVVVGVLENNEYLVASDVTALAPFTRNVVYLLDGEVMVLDESGMRLLPMSKVARNVVVEKIDWELADSEKGKYPHFMLKEIFEIPEALENSFRGRLVPEEGLVKFGGLENYNERLRAIEKIYIVACGTSYYASILGKYILEELTGVPTEVEYASEFRYRSSALVKNSVAIFISQSGETADTLAALREAKRRGILTLGIVNVVGSTIAREVDAGIYNHIGPEISVASTKAFISQASLLNALAVYIGRLKSLDTARAQEIIRDLVALPKKIASVLSQADSIRSLVAKYAKFSNFLYLGRKYNYPVALEGALKLKEISYIHAEGYASGEMKHGPIALIDQDFPVVFLIPQDSVYHKSMSNLEEIRARNAIVLAVATEGDRYTPTMVNDCIFIPKAEESVSAILATVPLQLFAYYMAVARGRDVDQPRNLAKSVTVE